MLTWGFYEIHIFFVLFRLKVQLNTMQDLKEKRVLSDEALESNVVQERSMHSHENRQSDVVTVVDCSKRRLHSDCQGAFKFKIFHGINLNF